MHMQLKSLSVNSTQQFAQKTRCRASVARRIVAMAPSMDTIQVRSDHLLLAGLQFTVCCCAQLGIPVLCCDRSRA